MVTSPTRERNILDLVLTNVPRYVTEVKVTPTTLSDHKLVELLLGFNLINPSPPTAVSVDPHSFRAVNYHNADFGGMNSDLATIDWIKLWELCERQLDTFLHAARPCAPTQSTTATGVR